MTRLHRTVHIARLALVWFVLSIGVAVASPLVRPQAVELICTGAGAIKLMVQTDDGAQEVSGATLDCPLCIVTGTPPPDLQTQPVSAPLRSHAPQPVAQAPRVCPCAAPLPARGPPALI